MTAWLQTGKSGDVISALAILYHEHLRTGEKQSLVIGKDYAHVVDGVDYVQPVIWGGDWKDFGGAYAWAKKQFKKVIPLSTFGKDITVQHKTPSWQLDQWLRSGIDVPFDELKLVLLRPENAASLASEYLGDKECVLLADESESSPFSYKEDLWNTLTFHFPEYRIVRLSEIKLPNIKDFLALYDRAICIVSIDTAFLHLSRATQTPVIAWAYDGDVRWRGSAWLSKYAFYGRYSEYESRKDEMVKVVQRLTETPVQSHEFKAATPHAYNLSRIKFGNEYVSSYRHHPEKGKWKTELFVDDAPLLVPDELKQYSLEDGRLFIHEGKLWLSYVVSVYPSTPARCAVGYGPLVKEGEQWGLVTHYQPKYGNNDLTGMEKNWSFFSNDGRLFAIYGSEPQQIVIELKDGRVITEHKSEPPRWKWGGVRGGAVVPHGTTLLRIFHTLAGDHLKYYAFRYHIGALMMDAKPPFRVTHISKFPILSGHEGWTNSCTHWKPNVVFPCGITTDGQEWTVSYGENDCACKLLSGNIENLNLEPYVLPTSKPATKSTQTHQAQLETFATPNKPTPRGTWVTRGVS
jgi:hypothetical protein